MSIYINGMDMPKDKPLTLVIYPDGTVANVYEEQRGTAVPVPQHGDLIDRDALIKELGIGDLPIRLTHEIINAPIIIPAEEAVT